MTRLLACVGIALAFNVVSAHAQVPVEEIVTLAPSNNFTEGCDIQVSTRLDQIINPNASRSPFVIPAGSVFVLTGANFARNGSAGNGLNIVIRNLVTNDFETVATVPAQALAGTYGAGSLMLTPGVVVGHGTAICTSLSTPGGISAAGAAVRIYGYFAKANKIKASAPVAIDR